MLEIYAARINRQLLKTTVRSHLVTAEGLTFGWALKSGRDSNRQASCKIVVMQNGTVVWDSGVVQSSEQSMAYSGPALPEGVRLDFSIVATDCHGETSALFNDYFIISDITWCAGWIAAPQGMERTEARYFRKTFKVPKQAVNARLYVCGIGYQQVFLNGKPTEEDTSRGFPLDPAFTCYPKQAQYVLYPGLQDKLQAENCIGIVVGLGWRDNELMRDAFEKRGKNAAFRGDPMLTAILVIDYSDGSSETIVTDESWTCSRSHGVQGRRKW